MKSIPVKFNVLVSLFIMAGLYSCKKDKMGPPNVIGKWVSQSHYKTGQVNQDIYQFNADSTFSQTRLIADSVSNQPLSYQYIGNGKFHLAGNTLQFYKVAVKFNSYYVALDQLTTTSYIDEVNYTLAVNANKTEFHFVFGQCPINASCLGPVSYYKK